MTESIYFTQEELNTNINTEYGFDYQVLSVIINGNAEFMIDLARSTKMSYTIPSLALHIVNIFFQKKAYIFYDRYLILTAAFVLATKLKDIDCRLKSVCHSYYNVIANLTASFEPFNEEKMKRIKDQICIYETQILRTLQYKVDFVSPHDYLKKYIQTIQKPKEQIRKIYNATRIIILDSYRTRCCLLYTPLTIFVSAFMLSCRYQGIRPYDVSLVRQYLDQIQRQNQKKNQKPNELSVIQGGELVQVGQIVQKKVNQIEQQKLQRSEQKLKQGQKQKYPHEFLYETWLKLLHQRQGQQIQQKDVLQCIKMMNGVIGIW